MKKKRSGEPVKKESLVLKNSSARQKGVQRRKTEKYTPNTKWLFSLLSSKGITQQEIAKQTGMPKGTLSKILHGKRRPTLKEIGSFAEILATPLDEILSAFGVNLAQSATSSDFLEVSGWLDADLILRGVIEQSGGVAGLRGSKTAPCPFPDRDIRVARIQTAGSSFDGLDGALVYYRETHNSVKGVDQEAVGRLGLVRVTGEPERRLRVLRRGYAVGKFNLTSLSGKLMEESVVVESVYPVVWLKF